VVSREAGYLVLSYLKVRGGTGASLIIDDTNGHLDSLTVANCEFDGESANRAAIRATNGYFMGDIVISSTTFKNYYDADHVAIFGHQSNAALHTGVGEIKTVTFTSNIVTHSKGMVSFRGHTDRYITTAVVTGN
jgi:hypothetical protein